MRFTVVADDIDAHILRLIAAAWIAQTLSRFVG